MLCSFEGPWTTVPPPARPPRVRADRSRTISGGFGVGETPLPIPNRAVKPHSADGTWPSRARESRSPPVLLKVTSRPRGRLGVVLARAARRPGPAPLAGSRPLAVGPPFPANCAGEDVGRTV